MRVAADSGDTLYPEVKRFNRESGLFEEGHDEAAETAIDVQTDVVLLSQLSESDDVVLVAVWEVDTRTSQLRTIPVSRAMKTEDKDTDHDRVPVTETQVCVSFDAVQS